MLNPISKEKKLKKDIEELIKYVSGWVYGSIVKAGSTYKLLDLEDRKI